MILLDNNQIILASIFQSIGKDSVINESILRHIVLNTYRMYKTQFEDEYGDLVICHDSANCWRKDFFKEYKANRKAKQSSDKIDWDNVFNHLSMIRNEIRETFPYRNIQVDRTEADDIIAVLCKEFHQVEKIVIVSNDKDFQQLQIYPHIKQYSPLKKTFLVCENPTSFLTEHIIKGDSSDGIPNILSDDDVFVTSKRQKRLTKKVKEQIDSSLSSVGCVPDDYKEKWERNKKMIDLNQIPEDKREEILSCFSSQTHGNRNRILDYMIKHKLKNLTEHIEDF